jgi:hypothetical protein
LVRAANTATRAIDPWINWLNSAIDIAYRVTAGGVYRIPDADDFVPGDARVLHPRERFPPG